jgi:hypothetical protein
MPKTRHIPDLNDVAIIAFAVWIIRKMIKKTKKEKKGRGNGD